MDSRALVRPLARPCFRSVAVRRTQTQRRWIASDNAFLKISPEVREALHAKKPVVALETTIYTHGYPYPDNIALASELESIIRVNGGVPATIGIIDGVAKAGLTPEELIELGASSGKENTLKLSRRDLSYVLGNRLAGKRFNGGTTIAGTMILAHLAGIKVFATGGLGGVHRGAEVSMDISADLTELGRTPVAVISSGCKSFLDLPRTLEYLETEGATVGTFADGREGNVGFPQFWSRDSGVKSPLTIANEAEAAAIIYAQMNLPLHSGMLFANPVPEEASIPREVMDVYIQEAISTAPPGKDNTPYVLNKIKELSKGKSVAANRALIVSNVKRGTLVAKELAALETKLEGHKQMVSAFTQSVPPRIEKILTPPASPSPKPIDQVYPAEEDVEVPADIVVAGALACDYSCDPIPGPKDLPHMHTSNRAVIRQTLGGVSHNVAKAAHYLGANVKLVTMVGDDLDGNSAISQLEAEQLRVDGIEVVSEPNARTARYVAVNNSKKDLVVAMADMDSLNQFTPVFEGLWMDELKAQPPKYFVADANWVAPMLSRWFTTAKEAGAYTAFEPVSTTKSKRLFEPIKQSRSKVERPLPVFPTHNVDLITPNALELAAMHSTAQATGLLERQGWWAIIDALGIPSSGARSRFMDASSKKLVDEGIPQRTIQLLPFVPTILTKLGSEGVLLTMLLKKGDERLQSAEAAPYIISRGHPESEVGGVYMRLFGAVEQLDAEKIVSVNGVGDTFLGALVAGMNSTGKPVEELVDFAQRAAVLTLQSAESVSPELKDLDLRRR